MTKWTLSLEGDTCEDREDFRMYFQLPEVFSVLYEVKQKIRSRLKYQELTDSEDKFLEAIYSDLCKIEDY